MSSTTADGRWRHLTLLGAAELTAWGVLYYAFSVIQVPMAAELGWSPTLLAGGFSLGLLVYAIAGPWLGRRFDRHGARGSMLAGCLGGAGVLLAWSQVDHPAVFVGLMALLGLAMAGCLYEAAFWCVAAWFDGRRARALTILTLFGALAGPLYLPLTERLCSAWGWRTALVVLAAALVLLALPCFARLPAGNGRAAKPTADPASVRSALHEPRFWWLQLGFIATSLTAVAIPVHLVPVLVARGETLAFAALVTGCIPLVGIAGRLLYGVVGEGRGLVALTATVFVLMSVAVTVLLAIPNRGGVALFVALFGLGYGALWPARAALAARAWSGPAFGAIAGTFALGPNLAKAAAPLLAAAIAWGSDLRTAFAALAVLPALAAVAIWRGGR